MTKKIEWLEAECPVCSQNYSYIKGGDKPSTCPKIECLYIYLHQSPQKGGDRSNQERLASG